MKFGCTLSQSISSRWNRDILMGQTWTAFRPHWHRTETRKPGIIGTVSNARQAQGMRTSPVFRGKRCSLGNSQSLVVASIAGPGERQEGRELLDG